MDDLTRLLLDAREGDRVALSALVRRTQADVWRTCAHLVDVASADDLTQDVYLRASRAIDGFRGEASARTWLLAIARNVCADELRRRQRRQRLLGAGRADDRVPDPAGEVALTDLVSSLDPDKREAFVLTQVIGSTYAEAARTLDVPIGTVRSRVARAREELVRRMPDDDAGRSTG